MLVIMLLSMIPYSTWLMSQLFVDKDTLMNAINTSHDLHLLKIDEKVLELFVNV